MTISSFSMVLSLILVSLLSPSTFEQQIDLNLLALGLASAWRGLWCNSISL